MSSVSENGFELDLKKALFQKESPVNIVPWDDHSLAEQKQEFENQALVFQIRDLLMQWARTYTHLAHDLVEEFGEEEVLDILEQTWWNLQSEGGSTFREDFEKDPRAGLENMYTLWHTSSTQGVTGIVMATDFNMGRWDLLSFRCYHHQVALELEALGGRKIGISWCMGDIAATRGWCSKVSIDFPNMQLRGDPFCRQIRQVTEDPNPLLDHWSRELSEQYGWRSIKKLEG
jgi:hypothetical protein